MAAKRIYLYQMINLKDRSLNLPRQSNTDFSRLLTDHLAERSLFLRVVQRALNCPRYMYQPPASEISSS
jgi:hypothetical protein